MNTFTLLIWLHNVCQALTITYLPIHPKDLWIFFTGEEIERQKGELV